jgi:hypothetical protein
VAQQRLHVYERHDQAPLDPFRPALAPQRNGPSTRLHNQTLATPPPVNSQAKGQIALLCPATGQPNRKCGAKPIDHPDNAWQSPAPALAARV